ncbi:ribonuclease H-like domain-containing protein [Amphibacillus sp. MSJ-3]|uniref:DNA polymerase n=1 Tax=Amphibacillus sp. MSJ-3 TaxID=2841505 RepID=UPI001C0F211C|nr:ribonuclease H-like domain-containing protein [Amphibacillus sp. MSJ-3]
MDTLAIDIETYSSYNLLDTGVYRYAEAPDFEILLFAYSFNDDPVEVIDLTWDDLPDRVLKALTDKNTLKTAFNAQFEFVCINKHFNLDMDIRQWQCTMVHALTLGLPGSLANVAKALGIEERKDTAGTALINYFSKPCRPTKANGKRTRNLPEHDPEKWANYIKYNRQDVVVEKAIKNKLSRFPISEREQTLWELDQRINGGGVKTDLQMVLNAIKIDETDSDRLLVEAKKLTGLDNPNSTAQLKKWVEDQGESMPNVQKATVEKLANETENEAVKRALEIRQQLSKTSVKKYYALQATRCDDGRVRGLMQHYGANRTGRWAGRLVQVQNLPGISMGASDLDSARSLVVKDEGEMFGLLYPVADTLSQLIRTALVAEEGSRFIVSDFSAIEARVIAWLANEKWRIDVFKGHGKIYEASASQMFNVPIENVTRENGLRAKGKVAELALGYQGSLGALKQMGGEAMGLSEEEMEEIVQSWRLASPNIVQFWYDVGNAALKAVKDKAVIKLQYGLQFSYESGFLFIRLPSGRRLAYVRPRIKENKFGRDAIFFDGARSEESTYGGKLVENIVQATARDLLADNLLKLDGMGYKTVFHVHDEVVCEMPYGQGSLEEVEQLMSEPIEWAPGLPLSADGFETEYYKKD